jgi:hypothetical protein
MDIDLEKNGRARNQLLFWFLLFAPSVLMMLFPVLAEAWLHGGEGLGRMFSGFAVALVVGFIIAVFPAIAIVKKLGCSSLFPVRVFGVAALIMVVNMGIAFGGCMLVSWVH